MTDADAGFDRVQQMLAAEARRALGDRVGEHPELDELSAYLAGELDEDADDAVRAHLVACRQCSGQLLDLEPMSQPDIDLDTLHGADEGPADAAVVDFGKAAAWRELSRRRLETPSGPLRSSRLRTYGALAAMLLASVALAVVMAPYFGGTASDGVAQANVPIHYLDELTRSRSVDETTLEVDADAAFWVLILTPPVGESFPSYEVELVAATDDGDETVLFRSDGLLTSDHGALRLGVPRELVPEGASTLRLRGIDGGRVELLEEYPLQIRYR